MYESEFKCLLKYLPFLFIFLKIFKLFWELKHILLSIQQNTRMYFFFLTGPQLSMCFLSTVWVFNHTNQPTAATRPWATCTLGQESPGKHRLGLNSWPSTVHFISVSVHVILCEHVVGVHVHISLFVWRLQDGIEYLPQSLWDRQGYRTA